MHAAETVLLKLLGGQQHFMVPLFQRVYTWKQENWAALWRDVAETYELGPQGRHFLGSIVTKSQPATPEGVSPFLVIDGQQRLTTLTILLGALRDAAHDTLPQLARKIQDLYLTNQYASGNSKYKVLPTQGDRDDYHAVIEGKFPAAAMSARTPILSAYAFFRARLAEPDADDAPLDLERLTQTVVGGLEIVSITLGEADNEYRIFESLNGTGMPLTQADLLRNSSSCVSRQSSRTPPITMSGCPCSGRSARTWRTSSVTNS